jgi:phage gp36-like protein
MTAYISRQQLADHVGANVLAGVSTAKQDAVCARVNALFDGAFRGRFVLPIVSWDVNVTAMAAQVAIYDLLSIRGFASDGSDDNYRSRHSDAMRWLKQVVDGDVTPGIVDSSSIDPGRESQDSAPWAGVVLSRPMRGY